MSTLTIDVRLDQAKLRAALESEVRAGLLADRKRLSPVWFYDERGSELFDEITRLPEYYPTRAEREILRDRAGAVAAETDADTLIELGSGTSEKTTLLLQALTAHGTLKRYVPLDVSEATLRAAAAAISTRFPTVDVHGIVGDFHHHVAPLPPGERRLVAFLGGTIGNLLPDQRHRFLRGLSQAMGPDDHFLLGVDLVKDLDRLVAAYDDAAGVTAEFNRNALRHLNATFDGDFDLESFVHVADWNEAGRWMEMRLRSTRNQTARLARLDLEVPFVTAEELLTEISAKFQPEQVAAEVEAAGLEVTRSWSDAAGDFFVCLCRPIPGAWST